MGNTETLDEFYRDKYKRGPADGTGHLASFDIFRFDDCPHDATVQYSRRDFFTIALLKGDCLFHYADQSQRVSGSTLLFFSPDVPYAFEPITAQPTGYFCIFQEAYYTERYRGRIRDLPMFGLGSKPSYVLTKTQEKAVSRLFKKMEQEVVSDYAFKYDLIRNYVAEVIHCALKMQPADTLFQPTDANGRITAVFLELLERQFPLTATGQPYALRSARDFAERMALHVNHLNRALKLTTGKTTTAHVTQRLTQEAKALLKHTDWNVATISHVLGFEDGAHFNHFFKRQTRLTPSVYRTTRLQAMTGD